MLNSGYIVDADYNASLNILNLGKARQSMVAESARANEVDICLLN